MKISEPIPSHLLLYPCLSQWKKQSTPYIIPPCCVQCKVDQWELRLSSMLSTLQWEGTSLVVVHGKIPGYIVNRSDYFGNGYWNGQHVCSCLYGRDKSGGYQVVILVQNFCKSGDVNIDECWYYNFPSFLQIYEHDQSQVLSWKSSKFKIAIFRGFLGASFQVMICFGQVSSHVTFLF